jgi:hypothetical protein
MDFAGINWLAVLVSAVVAFASGGIWFGPRTFYPMWHKAMGRKDGEIPGGGMNMGIIFGATAVAQLVQATTMGIVIAMARGAAGPEGLGAVEGALVGLLVGVGIAAASSLSHRLFGGFGFKVWILEVSNDAINLALMGMIIGAWR